MSENQSRGFFHADFTYTDAVLRDFEALYLKKKEISPLTRAVLGGLGLVGAGFFGYLLYKNGFQFTYVGYLIICSILLLVAFHRGGKRPDDSLAKYRRYYQDKGASIRVDDTGVELKIEGQKNPARSKFKEVYGLFDTDMCWYFLIKGRAYYILPKDAVEGGTPEEFKKYMEKKCAKHFLHYELDGK